jgi:hypothetical protein
MSYPNRKIIDFRNRPPVEPFKGLYELKANFLMKAGMSPIQIHHQLRNMRA